MKKTLTVNLGGTVYHIDEDAYVLLDNYLNNLKYHFRSETDADEIVRDMENRIAELFSEYISHGQQVITIENVEEVIARMGRPEEINTDDIPEVDFSDGLKTHAPRDPPEGSLSLSAHSNKRFLLTCASASVTVLIHLRSGGNSFSCNMEGFARNASMLPQRNLILFRVMGLSSMFSRRVTQRRFSTRLFR